MAHKCGPFTLVTLIDKWSKGEVTNLLNAVPDEATYLAKFKSDVGKEVSRQLHAAIMKSARRFLIDEVIRDVVPDLIATKKAQRELDRAQKCKVPEAIWLLPFFFATATCIYRFRKFCIRHFNLIFVIKHQTRDF